MYTYFYDSAQYFCLHRETTQCLVTEELIKEVVVSVKSGQEGGNLEIGGMVLIGGPETMVEGIRHSELMGIGVGMLYTGNHAIDTIVKL